MEHYNMLPTIVRVFRSALKALFDLVFEAENAPPTNKITESGACFVVFGSYD